MTSPLFVDVYPGDGHKDWRAFCAAGAPWSGVIFKASQGTRYRYDAWLVNERSAFASAAGERYGVDLFDGAYHYLDLAITGALQADYFVRAVELGGGERLGTLWGMVDVERGGQTVPPAQMTRSLVEDRVRAFAARYQQLTGRTPTLYGGELLRSMGVRDRLGCGRSAVALYSVELHGAGESASDFLARTGTDLEHLLFWQYRGTEAQSVGPRGYPMVAPGCGAKCDINAMTMPGGIPALRAGLWAERPAA